MDYWRDDMTQEEKDYWDEYAKFEAEEEKKFENALEYYKEHCIVPFEQTEDVGNLDFENGTFRHIGYCTVVKTDYKNCFYPSGEYFKVDKNETEETFDTLNFFKVEEEGFHTLVWQTVGICGDDYSGYILYPMNDGRYWVVHFCNI